MATKRPAKPKPTSAPAAIARANAEESAAAERSKQIEQEESETNVSRVLYPMFPGHPSGSIVSYTIYRKHVDPTKQNGWAKTSLAWHWDITQTDRSTVESLFGGGSFEAHARGPSGTVVGVVKWSAIGPEKIPGMQNALEQTGLSAHETPGGWVTLPGFKPEQNAVLIAYQQQSHTATLTADKAMAAFGSVLERLIDNESKMMAGMAELVRAPFQTMELMRGQLEAVRADLTQVRNDAARSREENLKLTVALAKGEKPSDQTWADISKKGIDMLDNIGGALLNKMLQNGLLPNGSAPPATNANGANAMAQNSGTLPTNGQ